MKHIIIACLLLFALPASAMKQQSIAQSLKSTPTMSETCVKHIAKYNNIISHYERVPKARRSALAKFKLGHFKAQLLNWKGYCADPDNSVSKIKR